MHTITSTRKTVDGECNYEVVSLLDNYVGMPRHTTSVMIAVEKMVALEIPRPCFGNVYLAQYRLVVLLLERETKY